MMKKQEHIKQQLDYGNPDLFEMLTEVDGYKVIITDHAKKRCLQRHGMPLANLTVLFKDMAGSLSQVPVVEYNQEVFLYSRKWQRGCIAAFRRDFKNPDSTKLALVVVTVYPYGRAVPAAKDTPTYYV